MLYACNELVTHPNLVFQRFRFFVLARPAKDEEYFGQLNELGCPSHPHSKNHPRTHDVSRWWNTLSTKAEAVDTNPKPNPNPHLHAP
jgi:hypothetical protein